MEPLTSFSTPTPHVGERVIKFLVAEGDFQAQALALKLWILRDLSTFPTPGESIIVKNLTAQRVARLLGCDLTEAGKILRVVTKQMRGQVIQEGVYVFPGSQTVNTALLTSDFTFAERS
jgi:acyl-CoA synthetase (AMP-forming)/AMP-acid ligase II